MSKNDVNGSADGQKSDGGRYKSRLREQTIGDLYPEIFKTVGGSGASSAASQSNGNAFGYNAGHLPGISPEPDEVSKILDQLTGGAESTSDSNNLNAANICVAAIQKLRVRSDDANPAKERKDKGVPRGSYRSKLIRQYAQDFSNINVLGYIPANNTPGLVDGESAYLVKFDGEAPFNLRAGRPFHLERAISYGKGDRFAIGNEKYNSGALAEGIKSVILGKPSGELAQNVYADIISGKITPDFSGAFVLIVRPDKK